LGTGRAATRTCGTEGTIQHPNALEVLPNLVDVLVVAATYMPDPDQIQIRLGHADKGELEGMLQEGGNRRRTMR
jgi:hypothetical protein